MDYLDTKESKVAFRMLTKLVALACTIAGSVFICIALVPSIMLLIMSISDAWGYGLFIFITIILPIPLATGMSILCMWKKISLGKNMQALCISPLTIACYFIMGPFLDYMFRK